MIEFEPDPEEECDLFTGHVSADGYGRIRRKGIQTSLAHRFAWEQAHGPIPEGYEIHHVCRNRSCVNPAHLKMVTRPEHRAIEVADRMHCQRGHSYAEHGRLRRGRNARYCRVCDQEKQNERRAAARLRISFEPAPELEWEVDSDMDVEILFTPENLPASLPEEPE